jgi:glycosyltransferase involved in cell wall biosynthesis
MRLTLVTETFPPELNGVARTLGRWAETFSRRGHAVDVIRPLRPTERESEDSILPLPVPFYPQVRMGLALPRQLARRFRAHLTQIVHIATEGPLGLAALFAARWLRLPVASSFHTNFDHYLSHYGLAGWEWCARTYLRWFHNRTAVTLVPSQATLTRLERAGFQRLALWPRGVDGQLFHPQRRDDRLRAELGLQPDDLLLLYVGRLAWEKNLGVLLNAFAQMRHQAGTQGQRIKLALVGDGPLLANLRERAMPEVHLAGPEQGLALARWFASADVFAFPSRSETFGNVILEAQASGLPVVAFRYPALEERIRHGEDGLLLGDDAELAPCLVALCQDSAWRRRLGQAARLTAERQTWEPIFDRLEATYARLIPTPSTRRVPRGQRLLIPHAASWTL